MELGRIGTIALFTRNSEDRRARGAAETIVERTLDAFGGLDILLNNAGAAAGRSFEQINNGV